MVRYFGNVGYLFGTDIFTLVDTRLLSGAEVLGLADRTSGSVHKEDSQRTT